MSIGKVTSYLLVSIVSLVFLIAKANAAISIPQIETLSSNNLLKSKTDEPFTVIKIPPLYTAGGNKASGPQLLNFTLHGDAPGSVVVNGQPVSQGQTIQITVNASSNGGLDIPIYPGLIGAAGEANYTISLSVKGISCPLGFTLSGELCYKTLVEDPIKVCPSGFKYNESNNNCTKTVEINATKTCPSGTSLEGTLCKGTTSTTASSSCPAGYTRSSNTCYKDTQINATKNCPAGYSVSGSECKNVETVEYNYMDCRQSHEYEDDTIYNMCPTGTYPAPNSYNCTFTTNSASQCVVEEYGVGQYKCDEDEVLLIGYLSPSQCKGRNGGSRDAPLVCPDGYTYIGGAGLYNCRSIHSYQANKSCPSGYLDAGNQCEKVHTANITYTCPSQYDLSGSKCNMTVSADLIYSCPNGGSLSESDCVNIVTSPITYSCPVEYTLAQEHCIKTESVPSTNTCIEGWELEGGRCTMTETVVP
ncbi:hypothetical protein J8L73_18735 [Pseudoalteromonas sp. MMG006]|uniref:hypothetical protein n=1 Tax=Pseudoalteromonas sp. MMG006 TaxID=2822683 RepID=UPI001B39191A|nr:hypothetical protein [Pseudoalteromonas sp. MMG006]MBQ4801130.1 hypothetical protein [Pseudoalteromonas sp. MMG006]